MQHKYNGQVYNGFMELSLATLRVLKMSDDATRIICFVQNEDMIDMWLIEPHDPSVGVEELIKFYIEEEPWATFDDMSFYTAARDHGCDIIHKDLIQKLVNEGKLKKNEKTGHLIPQS